MSTYFHFTIGPVQGFVAQARRTRDFWAGSFILSLLAAVAMEAVRRRKGTILFPKEDPEFLAWLRGEKQGAAGRGGAGPAQGSIPNRFMAQVPDDFQGARVTAAVTDAWTRLAETVWRRDLAPCPGVGEATRAIWERQVAGFWDMAWALSRTRESDLLDRRKNWRGHRQPDEQGVKCMMMDGWQELSGALYPEAKGQDDFWNGVRTRLSGNDLREKECLCAIAFVKRRLIRHFKSGLKLPLAEGWTLHGWDLPPGVPSVAYLAAAPWLKKAIETVDGGMLASFADTAAQLGEYGEWHTRLGGIQAALQGKDPAIRGFARLDGDLFYESTLENHPDPDRARSLLGPLRRLYQATGAVPSPYYAVLLMDGDSLGKQMSDAGKQEDISQALARFTWGVPDIVEAHSGFLVYAGGDDVLAVLPLPEALPCAAQLRTHYEGCFKSGKVRSTISAAVVYAHIHAPLTRVLKESHRLLDAVAKEGRGRDAVAVQVRNPGGPSLEWAMPWALALEEGGVIVQRLAAAVHRQGRDGDYASGFFYRIRERLELLNPANGQNHPMNESTAVRLMAAEYLNSGIHEARARSLSPEEARATLECLLGQCRPRVRETDPASGEALPQKHWTDLQRWEADGALLVRFLAREGGDR